MTRFLAAFSALAVLVVMPMPASAILQKGQAAPPLKTATVTGENLSLTDYKGNVVIVDFFATWCIPCQTSIPHLLNLKRKYAKQGLQVLGMSVDEDGKSLRSFMNDKKITYPVALANEDVQTEYGLRSVPTVYVVNKRGMIAEKYQGFNDDISRSMETLVRKLLAE